MRIEIRRAVSTDSERATELARIAKAHWGYPADWLASWDADDDSRFFSGVATYETTFEVGGFPLERGQHVGVGVGGHGDLRVPQRDTPRLERMRVRRGHRRIQRP